MIMLRGMGHVRGVGLVGAGDYARTAVGIRILQAERSSGCSRRPYSDGYFRAIQKAPSQFEFNEECPEFSVQLFEALYQVIIAKEEQSHGSL